MPTHVALVEKQKSWCRGLHNGIGGMIELSDVNPETGKIAPLVAQRREFLEETGLNIQNWEFFCQLREPSAVVEFFRADVPLKLLQQVRTVTTERIVVMEFANHGYMRFMPNLSWLLPLARSQYGIIANVEEFGGPCAEMHAVQLKEDSQ